MPDAALVRAGSDTAILRAEVVDEARVQLLEAEIRASGRNRVQLNRNPVQRSRDLLGLMRVTVFAPDDHGDRSPRDFTLWLSDDPARIPLRLQVPIGFGDVVVELVEAVRAAR